MENFATYLATNGTRPARCILHLVVVAANVKAGRKANMVLAIRGIKREVVETIQVAKNAYLHTTKKGV